MDEYQLENIARALVAAGKGILAADESAGTIQKRLDSIQVPSTEENRRAYRELLFTTPDVEAYISGVILFDETLRQASKDGKPFPQVLSERGIQPGIKVDKGTQPLPGFPGEMITEGLDGLHQRLVEYRDLGARFTKWRAVISIDPNLPTRGAILANAHALARFAAISQDAGLVPIVEPEVLMDGDHSLEQCFIATEATLHAVFAQLIEQRVFLEGMLLKPNMVLPGKINPQQASPQEIAAATISCLRRSVPAAVPGIVFLSGGQTAEQATANLNAMNQSGPHPWQLSFSYGRALQEPVLNAWRGQETNAPAAQQQFALRARLNGAARYGAYRPEMESGLA